MDRTPSATLVCGLYLGPWSCIPEKEGHLAWTGQHPQLLSVDYTLVPGPVPRGGGPPGLDRTPSATLVCGLYLGPWSCTPEKEGHLAWTVHHPQLWSVDYTLVPGPVPPRRRATWRGQDTIRNSGLWIIPWSLVLYPPKRKAIWRGQDTIRNSGLWIIPWSLVLYP